MTFDPKMLAKSPAWATAGGVVIGAGIFTFISATLEHLIRPFFNFIFTGGVMSLSREHGVYLGCGAFLTAGLILAACTCIAFLMIKMAGKS